MKKYQLVALGGTFDHFHKGHKQFLAYAFSLSRQVVIGITTDRLAQNKSLPQAIQPLTKRKQSVISFLGKEKFRQRAKLVLLKDMYGPTLRPDSIQALVATKVTHPGARQVNRERNRRGLPNLPIHICPMVKSDDRRYLSSTRIRQGRVSASGRVYRHLFTDNLSVPDQIRRRLRQPQGQLLTKNIAKKVSRLLNQSPPLKVALVGDEVTQFFKYRHLCFHYAAVDLKIGRQPVDQPLDYSFTRTVKNQSGTISKRAAQAIWQLQQRNSGILKVVGEEDLLVIPFVLSLPLTSLVIYGQPGQGIVVVTVDETAKTKFAKRLQANQV